MNANRLMCAFQMSLGSISLLSVDYLLHTILILLKMSNKKVL